jgi:hypothetical protein
MKQVELLSSSQPRLPGCGVLSASLVSLPLRQVLQMFTQLARDGGAISPAATGASRRTRRIAAIKGDGVLGGHRVVEHHGVEGPAQHGVDQLNHAIGMM